MISYVIGGYLVALIVGALLFPLLARRATPRIALIVASFFVAAGYLLFIPLHDQVWQVVLNMVIAGIGSGALVAALPSAAAAAAPRGQSGIATGLTNTTKTIGGAFASAVFGVILHVGLTSTATTSGAGLAAYIAVWTICGVGALVAAVLLFLVPKLAFSDSEVDLAADAVGAVETPSPGAHQQAASAREQRAHLAPEERDQPVDIRLVAGRLDRDVRHTPSGEVAHSARRWRRVSARDGVALALRIGIRAPRAQIGVHPRGGAGRPSRRSRSSTRRLLGAGDPRGRIHLVQSQRVGEQHAVAEFGREAQCHRAAPADHERHRRLGRPAELDAVEAHVSAVDRDVLAVEQVRATRRVLAQQSHRRLDPGAHLPIQVCTPCPMPPINRPGMARSSVASSIAVSATLRRGAGSSPMPTVIRSVAPSASAAEAIPLSVKQSSQTHSSSSPAASTARATGRSRSGGIAGVKTNPSRTGMRRSCITPPT